MTVDSARRASPRPTDWLAVALLIGAGVACALHAGKVPGTLPLLSQELGLSLTQGGVLEAGLSLCSAVFGLAMGLVADRLGAQRTLLAGLCLGGVASLGGAGAQGLPALLAWRALEGLGFISSVVAVPSLIVGVCQLAHRRTALALWGVYVPLGMTLMMLVSAALLPTIGWRGLWAVAGVSNLAWAAMLWSRRQRWLPAASVAPAVGGVAAPAIAAPTLRELVQAALRRGPLLLSLSFVAYAALYVAVAAFLPTLLVQQGALSLPQAGLAGALVVACNILGNAAAAALAACGLPYSRVLLGASLGMGLMSLGLFGPWLDLPLRYACALGVTAIGGLIPGTLLSLAPQFASRPSLAGGVVGLMIQGAGIGQLLGPPLLGSLVDGFGDWSAALGLTLPCAAVCAACALGLRPRATARPGER